jgi:hypothetical protein
MTEAQAELAREVGLMTPLLRDWQVLRELQDAQARAEHPELVDHHGRVWTWVKGDLYLHCGMAWPRRFVLDGRHELPSDSVVANPNYELCSICRAGR